MEIVTLSIDDVVHIHRRIVEMARTHEDQIGTFSTGGQNTHVKDWAMLESAVGRQLSGSGGNLYYPDALSNAATLMYGVAMNHAFHDGNKRCAVVCLLNHLDRNRYQLSGLRWQEVEDAVLDLVRGDLPSRSKLKHVVHGISSHAERSVRALTEWVRQNARRIERGERSNITFGQLEALLNKHGFVLDNPSGNYISIYKVTTTERHRLFGKPTVVETRVHVGAMGHPGNARVVGVSELKKVRRICHLTEEHGVDSDAFYNAGERIDAIINDNRRLLRSLAGK